MVEMRVVVKRAPPLDTAAQLVQLVNSVPGVKVHV